MDELNKKINNLLEYLDIPEDPKRPGLYLTKNGSESLTLLKMRIRQILGFDKRCSQCFQYKMKYDLSLIEGSDKEICQDCLEKVMRGELQVHED